MKEQSETDDAATPTSATSGASSAQFKNRWAPGFSETLSNIKKLVDQQPYYKFNMMWSRHMENLSFVVVFMHWIETCQESEKKTGHAEPKLLSYEEVAKVLTGSVLIGSISL